MTAVREVMSDAVQTVPETADIDTARRLMQDIGAHAVPVVDAAGELCGIVTSIDLAEDLVASDPVSSVMTDQVHTVRPETEVSVAASFLRNLQINHLVVADDEAMVGIVSAWDLLESLAASVRAHTVDAVDVAPVAAGDELIVHRPGEAALRCRIQDVHGPGGLPPYIVVWDDDPEQVPMTLEIVRHMDVTMDGCER